MFDIPRGRKRHDAIAAFTLLVFCAFGIKETLTFSKEAAQWPLWMWGILVALSAGLLFGSLRASAKAAAQRSPENVTACSLSRVFVNVAFVIGFVALVPVIGFFTAGLIYLCGHMFYLGIRPLWRVVSIAAGTLAVLYVVFEWLLGVIVSHGFLF